MKICGISDIHGNLYNGIPECDVLCICGDIVPLNEQRSMDASLKWWQTRFAKWVDKLPCKKYQQCPVIMTFTQKVSQEMNGKVLQKTTNFILMEK